MRSIKRDTKAGEAANAVGRELLETLFFELQRERTALTCTIMELRGKTPLRRARIVMRIMVALLRLERANRRAMAALGRPKPAGS